MDIEKINQEALRVSEERRLIEGCTKKDWAGRIGLNHKYYTAITNGHFRLNNKIRGKLQDAGIVEKPTIKKV